MNEVGSAGRASLSVASHFLSGALVIAVGALLVFSYGAPTEGALTCSGRAPTNALNATNNVAIIDSRCVIYLNISKNARIGVRVRPSRQYFKKPRTRFCIHLPIKVASTELVRALRRLDMDHLRFWRCRIDGTLKLIDQCLALLI
jgi:hypothetical protein